MTIPSEGAETPVPPEPEPADAPGAPADPAADRGGPEDADGPDPAADRGAADAADGGASDQPRPAVRADARRAIEAIVLVSEQPLDVNLLGQLLELRPVTVEELCRELAAEYEADGRGFQLARVAGGWRFQSHPDQAPYVERFVLEGQTSKLSAAALETLAIVAYKQPISRAQVASIRGVSVDGVMRTLQQRGYIAEVGRDPGPGQATMFGTTRAFLERLGMNSLVDLPPLGEFVPGADVVEQLERGLRPEGPTIAERLQTLDDANVSRDAATKAPNGRHGAAAADAVDHADDLVDHADHVDDHVGHADHVDDLVGHADHVDDHADYVDHVDHVNQADAPDHLDDPE
jgi:segregation and condensation protein B